MEITERISRFDGGISGDPRNPDYTKGTVIKHFDIRSNPFKLIPLRDSEADTNDGSTSTGMKQYDVYHPRLGLNGKLYGLGKESNGYPKVVSKADPSTGNWTLEATAEGEAARKVGAFGEWQSAWWFYQGTNQLAKWTIGGTVTDTVATLGSTITTVAQPIVGADGNFYMFYNNKVVRINSSGTATDDVFSAIPSDMRITSVARWGSYLAIAVAEGTSATATPSGRSQLYIWDYVTDTTAHDIIDMGEGALQVIGNVEGNIIGVSNKYLEKSTGSVDLGVGGGSMVIRMWGGGIPRVVEEIVANQSVTLGRMKNEVVIKNNVMYWIASVPYGLSTSTESTYKMGIWSYGRKDVNSRYSLSLEVIEEDTDTSNYKINSFGNAGNYWFINHSADGSITKTDDTATYGASSIFETQILDGRSQGLDSSVTKNLKSVTVYFAPLPSAGSVSLAYRKDSDTSYTTIFSGFTTDNAVRHSAVNIESSGAELPDFKEIVFQVTSTGGAEITGIKWRYEPHDDDII